MKAAGRGYVTCLRDAAGATVRHGPSCRLVLGSLSSSVLVFAGFALTPSSSRSLSSFLASFLVHEVGVS